MKTGTSTLQATLLQNRELLAEANYSYFGWPMRTSEKIEEHLGAVGPHSNIIVSDEGLWHFCGTQRSDTHRIAQLLQGYETTIVVYFRRPDEYVESWFSQGLKNGRGNPRLVEFLSSGFVNSTPCPPSEDGEPVGFASEQFVERIDLSIAQKLAYMRTRFPDAEIIVRPYGKGQLDSDDIVTDFFRVTDPASTIPSDRFSRLQDENISPSADAVLFTSLVRQQHGVPENALRKYLTTTSSSTSAGRSRILRYHEAIAINEVMRPIFREVQDTWGGGAAEDFFVHWDIDPQTYRESSLRDLYDLHV